MALNTRLAFLKSFLHFFLCPACLFVEVHSLVGVAVAAFLRIVRLHRFPDMLSHLGSISFEFFGRINFAAEMVPEFICCFDFSDELCSPLLRHVAVGADCAHT